MLLLTVLVLLSSEVCPSFSLPNAGADRMHLPGGCAFRQGFLRGELAKLGQFPYQVILKRTPGGFSFCSGSILDERHVLTAGQCCRYIHRPIEVAAGLVNMTHPGEHLQVSMSTSIFLHPDFRRDVIEDEDGNSLLFVTQHDICVIKLGTPFKLSAEKMVTAVKLPAAMAPVPKWEEELLLSGWSLNYLHTTNLNPIILLFVRQHALSPDECRPLVWRSGLLRSRRVLADGGTPRSKLPAWRVRSDSLLWRHAKSPARRGPTPPAQGSASGLPYPPGLVANDTLCAFDWLYHVPDGSDNNDTSCTPPTSTDAYEFVGGCHGDPGGPLTSRKTGEIIGVVSPSSPPLPGAIANCWSPTTYTKVSAYVDWIREIIDSGREN